MSCFDLANWVQLLRRYDLIVSTNCTSSLGARPCTTTTRPGSRKYCGKFHTNRVRWVPMLKKLANVYNCDANPKVKTQVKTATRQWWFWWEKQSTLSRTWTKNATADLRHQFWELTTVYYGTSIAVCSIEYSIVYYYYTSIVVQLFSYCTLLYYNYY